MNVWCGAAVNTLGSCTGCFFWGADRIAVSLDEGRTGSDLAPEVSGDHLCRATAVGAINQRSSPAEIKAIIRVVIIVLVNTVPEKETLCESWSRRLWFAALQCGRAFVRTARGLCTPVNCLLVSALHLFSLCWKKLAALKQWVSFGLVGVTLSIAVVVGVLTDLAVGMCLARGRRETKWRQWWRSVYSWFPVWDLLIIKWWAVTIANCSAAPPDLTQYYYLADLDWLRVSCQLLRLAGCSLNV